MSSGSTLRTIENPAPSQILQGSLSSGPLYTIAVPAGYDGEEPAPLILGLHYSGHGAPFFGQHMLTGLIEPALRPLKAIIVAPDCTGQDWMDSNSEADVFALLDYISETYNIDTGKTLVTGYSMGGIGAWSYLTRFPDRFSAAVVMAGYPPDDVMDAERFNPLYVIHSRRDELIPLTPTEEAVDRLRAQGISVELVILNDVSHYETGKYDGPLKEAIPWIEEVWK